MPAARINRCERDKIRPKYYICTHILVSDLIQNLILIPSNWGFSYSQQGIVDGIIIIIKEESEMFVL